jgi:hypothetical protein
MQPPHKLETQKQQQHVTYVFNPEDRGGMLFRNVSIYMQDNTEDQHEYQVTCKFA